MVFYAFNCSIAKEVSFPSNFDPCCHKNGTLSKVLFLTLFDLSNLTNASVLMISVEPIARLSLANNGSSAASRLAIRGQLRLPGPLFAEDSIHTRKSRSCVPVPLFEIFLKTQRLYRHFLNVLEAHVSAFPSFRECDEARHPQYVSNLASVQRPFRYLVQVTHDILPRFNLGGPKPFK